jgi:hypothetical protein
MELGRLALGILGQNSSTGKCFPSQLRRLTVRVRPKFHNPAGRSTASEAKGINQEGEC